MNDCERLNLCPNSDVKPTPAFASEEEYERYREEFRKAVEPDIRIYALARFNSALRARDHFVG